MNIIISKQKQKLTNIVTTDKELNLYLTAPRVVLSER